MDFINSAVTPQSYHHLELIRFLLILTYMLFIPYLTLLIGTLGFSLWFDKKSHVDGNTDSKILSKKIIDFITPTKTLPFGLGIVPLISALFGYAQLLKDNSGIILSGVVFALASFMLAAFFIYKYKSDLHYSDILKSGIDSEDKNIAEDAKLLLSQSSIYRKYGSYALTFLVLTIIFFSGVNSEIMESSNISGSSNILILLLNGGTWISILFYLSLSFAFGTVVFAIVSKDQSLDVSSRLMKSILGWGIVATIIFLMTLTVGIVLVPVIAANSISFIMLLLAVLSGIVILNLFYMMIKEKSFRLSSALFFFFFVFILFTIVKDNTAFGTSSHEHFFLMSKQYDSYKTELLASMGVEDVVASGEDIYNGKCIACHQFDQKVVGPAYNNVLPKYEGKIDDLVKFILNPQKIDPAFPAMPGQGLKPNEARAIADYIISVYQQNKG